MEFDNKSVIDLALHFFFSNDEPSQAIISAFLHSLHCKKIVCVCFLDQKYFRIGASTETGDALEVLCRDIKVLISGLFVLFLILFDVKQHICSFLNVLNHLDIAVFSRVIKRCLLVLIDAFLRLVTCIY
jgi:hypothetical protein